jgi:TolB-like protein/DNA-binding SARP family transcriptional activator
MEREVGRRRAVGSRPAGGGQVVPLRRQDAHADIAQPAGAPIELQLLGRFGLRSGPGAARALPKKAQALLAYLAMQRGRPVPREQLAELLWGYSGGEQARRSLRQCLMAVRAALKASGEGTLVSAGDSVSLNAGERVAVDAVTFEMLGASKGVADLQAAAALYRGEFLNGLQVTSEPFADWMVVERRRFVSAMSDVLYRLALAHRDAGEIEPAISVAERLTALDPLREDGHRLLIGLLADAGQRSTALKQHALCVEILRRDLGVEPEPATTELANAIRKGGLASPSSPAAERPAVPPALALPDKPSIALLPFSNLSGDPEQNYFADGIADDLIIVLGRIPWLFVIASASTAGYRGRAVEAAQIGTELGVRYLLRGSVRKTDKRLRIVVQLTDASHGRHIWSDRFDGDPDEIFAIQDRVTAQVASFIAPALQLAEIERAQRKPTESLTAYDLYLRAVPRFRTSLAENREAIRLLRRAIEIDPSYGAAYGFAARCYQFQKLLNWVPPSDPDLEEGVRLGHLAVDIGKNDSEALWMGGHALVQLAGDVERGLALIDRSLELNPNSVNALVSSCNVRSYYGDPKTAIEHFGLAHRLNPLDSSQHVRWNILALAHLSAGDFEETERATDKALNVAPTYPPALRMKVIVCGLLGRAEAGREHVNRLLAVNSDESVRWLNAFWGPLMRRHPRLLADMLEGARRAGLPEG